LTIKAIELVGDQFIVSALQHPIVITPEQQLVIKVMYFPTKLGNAVGRLIIISDDPLNGELGIPLKGTVNRAIFSLDTLALDFGDVELGRDKTGTLTVQNKGNVTLTLHTVVVDNPAFITDFTGNEMIKPDSTYQLHVSFTPTEYNRYEANLQFKYFHAAEVSTTVKLTGIGVDPDAVPNGRTGDLPTSFSWSTYPNPFNPATQISYAIPSTGWTRMDVMDINGRVVGNLVDGVRPAGRYQVTWNASGVPAGVYIVRIEGEGIQAVRKMVLVK
jgi:hypothetical protein